MTPQSDGLQLRPFAFSHQVVRKQG